MTNWQAIVFGFALAAVVQSVSASCWQQQIMPNGLWNYEAWLCNSSQIVGYYYNGQTGMSGPFSMMLHGYIDSTNPSDSSSWRVWLDNFQYSSSINYPATLKCYKRMGVPGNYWYWYTGKQVTLTDGQGTSSSSPWVLAGCPPIQNSQHQPGSPPQVQISVSWSGYGNRGIGGKPMATARTAKR